MAGNPIFSRLMAIIAGLSVLHPRADWGRRTPSRALSKPALDVLQRAFANLSRRADGYVDRILKALNRQTYR